jgi:hypothetical protein
MEAQNSEQKVLVSSKVPVELEALIKSYADREKRTVSNAVYLLLESHPLLVDEKHKQEALAA